MMLNGLRAPEMDADLIAAQASDEIVRAGAFTAIFAGPQATNPSGSKTDGPIEI